MTLARSHQVDLKQTAYYHCISRCVRRSYLCGEDYKTGINYSHRKDWFLQQIKRLTGIFAIKVCAYAVMSNHYHLVLFVDEKSADYWDENDIRNRWGQLFHKDAKAWDALPEDCTEKFQKIALWNDRLMDISWFMRCLNETIARLANKEDQCKGRFWEGRFKSQALLDDAAVLSAMVYVDLNPIRAKEADSPENSFHTSIYERIHYAKKQIEISNRLDEDNIKQCYNEIKQPPKLMSFNNGKKTTFASIDFSLSEYLELIDETGRDFRCGKRGAISETLGPIFERLNLTPSHWNEFVACLEEKFAYAIGCVNKLCQFMRPSQKRLPKGAVLASRSYSIVPFPSINKKKSVKI